MWFAILEWQLFLPGYGDPNEMSYKAFRSDSSPGEAEEAALAWAGKYLRPLTKRRVLGVMEWR